MPVAIRSLNGYYGFLDSLRSLEMTTATEQISIHRGVSNYCRTNTLSRGEGGPRSGGRGMASTESQQKA